MKLEFKGKEILKYGKILYTAPSDIEIILTGWNYIYILFDSRIRNEKKK